jgi:hypothetical protein
MILSDEGPAMTTRRFFPLNRARCAIVQSWNLDRVRARMRRDTDLPLAEIDARIAEYRKFMCLVVSFDGFFPVSKPVDVVWHTHMLFAEDYEEMAKTIDLNCHLRHLPTLSDDDEAALLPDYQSRTLPALEYFFGPVSAQYWPADRCVCTGNGGGFQAAQASPPLYLACV